MYIYENNYFRSANMNVLSFYVSEKQHHAGMPLYEWLLEEAKVLGIPGGSAFRAIAGYGRHGKLHEETFFELAGELAVKVEFIVEESLAEKLLGVLLPSFAYAHVGLGEASGFVHGLAHPASGLDHVCAMLAVELWAAQTGGGPV